MSDTSSVSDHSKDDTDKKTLKASLLDLSRLAPKGSMHEYIIDSSRTYNPSTHKHKNVYDDRHMIDRLYKIVRRYSGVIDNDHNDIVSYFNTYNDHVGNDNVYDSIYDEYNHIINRIEHILDKLHSDLLLSHDRNGSMLLDYHNTLKQYDDMKREYDEMKDKYNNNHVYSSTPHNNMNDLYNSNDINRFKDSIENKYILSNDNNIYTSSDKYTDTINECITIENKVSTVYNSNNMSNINKDNTIISSLYHHIDILNNDIDKLSIRLKQSIEDKITISNERDQLLSIIQTHSLRDKHTSNHEINPLIYNTLDIDHHMIYESINRYSRSKGGRIHSSRSHHQYNTRTDRSMNNRFKGSIDNMYMEGVFTQIIE